MFNLIWIGLMFNLMDPAVEQGVLGKMHHSLLRREACQVLHLQVILIGVCLHPSQFGLVQLGHWSEVILFTHFLNTRKSLPVSGLKLSSILTFLKWTVIALPSVRGAPFVVVFEASCSWDSHCSIVVQNGWDQKASKLRIEAMPRKYWEF